MNIDDLLLWHKFNCYSFCESTHTYYYNDKKVLCSVTQFIHRFVEDFDKDKISLEYSNKHCVDQKEVLYEWDKNSRIASTTGTIIHSYMENVKRGKVFDVDLSKVDCDIFSDVAERVGILLPKAKHFHEDTLNKLYPIQLEYTVGIEHYIAGNIDMLCWNEKAQEFQIWDYKNSKEIVTTNSFGKKCFGAFSNLPDCNFSKYSIQLNLYKEIVERQLGIKIGKCYLVHFDYTKKDNEFTIYECLDLQNECRQELNKYITENATNG